MFLLNFIPDALILWVVNAILISGIVGTIVSFFFGFFARFIPQLYAIRMPLQIISLILLIGGVYFKGGVGVEMEWRARVAQLEAQIKESEAKSKETNIQIQKVYVDKVKVVKEKQIVVQEKIVEKEKIIDAECKVVPETIIKTAAFEVERFAKLFAVKVFVPESQVPSWFSRRTLIMPTPP